MKPIVIAVLSILVAGCGDAGQEGTLPQDARTTNVSTGLPGQQDIEIALTAIGSVESLHDPTVSAQTPGQVEQVVIREGDAVTEGQLLATLDSTLHAIETAKAEAEVRRYNVLVQNQQSEVKRLQRLDESQSVSRDVLEDEQAQLEILAAQRDVARKQWEHFRYLESKTRIVAPLDGLVTRRLVSTGDYVTPGQALFELVSVDRLRARIAFPERDASRIAVGQTVRLTTPTAPGVNATGVVAAVNPRIKMHNRAQEVIVEFDNPGGWFPGASVDATLVVERRSNALVVPQLAIVERNDLDVVFVIDGERARAVPVETGWRESAWVEIRHGISADDRVVVEGASLLTDGSRVGVEQPGQ
ncbi:MAG: efflux RND transporter periplasmic adaptor subunit [Halioglobus sp.]|nr:efflux RND transporter periplasmic adaptor subunit [Halioglobus sp.]